MLEKRLVLWGFGKIGKRLLKEYRIGISFIIDNNKNIDSFGYDVKTSDEIEQWDDLYIIVAVKDNEEIIDFLCKKGLYKDIDYQTYHDWEYHYIIKNLNTLLCKINGERIYKNVKIRNCEEWSLYEKEFGENYKISSNLIDEIDSRPQKWGVYRAYCSFCKSDSLFRVGCFSSNDIGSTYRDGIFCIKCGNSGRVRHLMDVAMSMTNKSSNIYIMEQTTPLYKALTNRFPQIIGSEFISKEYKGGDIIDGIRHEDATCLSLGDSSIDLIISADVFEHVNIPIRAFNECYRCLKPEGKLIFSIPFFFNQDTTLTRAMIGEDGKVKYLHKPVYHHNPISNLGSLVFNDFGWDIFKMLKNSGFTDAYMILTFDTDKAYLGMGQITFVAEK